MNTFKEFGYQYNENQSIGNAWIKLFRRSELFGDCFIVAFYPINDGYKCSFESVSRNHEIIIAHIVLDVDLNKMLSAIELLLE